MRGDNPGCHTPPPTQEALNLVDKQFQLALKIAHIRKPLKKRHEKTASNLQFGIATTQRFLPHREWVMHSSQPCHSRTPTSCTRCGAPRNARRPSCRSSRSSPSSPTRGCGTSGSRAPGRCRTSATSPRRSTSRRACRRSTPSPTTTPASRAGSRTGASCARRPRGAPEASLCSWWNDPAGDDRGESRKRARTRRRRRNEDG